MSLSLTSSALLAFCLLLSPAPAFAGQIKEIGETGIIRTAEGEAYSLAGIRLPPESLPLLSLLVAGNEVEIEQDSQPGPEVYLYVQAREIGLPFRDSVPKNSRILINRFLVELGAAEVLPGEFDKQEEFLAAQEKAREKGEGIWSYDPEFPKVKK
jgi:hypothetical protein